MAKKAVGLMFGLINADSWKSYFINNKIMTLPCIFIFQNLLHVKQNINKFNTGSLIHNHSTRQSNDLYIPHARLSKFMNSYRYLQLKFFNNLPFSFRNLELNMYKVKLSKWLLSMAFYSVDEFLGNHDFSTL